MNKLPAFWTPRFIDTFFRRVQEFNNLSPGAPLKGEFFEHQFYLSCIREKYTVTDYKFGSHKSGPDMIVNNNKISCKGGTLTSNSYKFSGSRTTSSKTLEEKLKFVTTLEEDYIIGLISTVNDFSPTIDYQLLLVDASKLKFNSLTWEKFDNKMTGTGAFKAEFIFTMSDQLWVEVPRTFIDAQEHRIIQYADHNNLQKFFD